MRLISLIALCAGVQYASASMSLASCNAESNGKTEWHGLVQYKCMYSSGGGGTSTKVALINCRTPASKKTLKPGQDTRDGDFHYECKGNDKQLAVSVAYCYMPGAGSDDLQVGESRKADGGIYECKEVSNKGKKSITRTFAKETLMCEVDGKKLKINEKTYPDAVTVLQCYNSGGAAKLKVVGCKLASKATIGMYQIRDGEMCQVKSGNSLRCELKKRDDKCKRNGKDKQVNTNWVESDGEYRCQYSNLNDLKKDHSTELKTTVIFNRCIKKINGKNEYINLHNLRKVNNKTYWCKGTKPSGSKDYKYTVVEMTDATKYTCDGGIIAHERKTENGVVYGCSFYNGKLKRYEHSCLADNGKSVSKNGKVDMGTYGWNCIKVDGKYVSRKMTDAEYKSLKSKSGSSVSASGGYGAGVEGYEKDKPTEPKCAEGFRLNPAKTTCVDIDECAEETDDCEDNERCMNTEGEHQCLCLAGQVRVDETDKCETLSCPCMGLPKSADSPKNKGNGKGKGKSGSSSEGTSEGTSENGSKGSNKNGGTKSNNGKGQDKSNNGKGGNKGSKESTSEGTNEGTSDNGSKGSNKNGGTKSNNGKGQDKSNNGKQGTKDVEPKDNGNNGKSGNSGSGSNKNEGTKSNNGKGQDKSNNGKQGGKMSGGNKMGKH